MKRCLLLFSLIICVRLFAQSVNQQIDFPTLLINYNADKGTLERFYTITNSPERRERFKKLQTEYLSKLEEINFQKLNTNTQVDLILFKRTLNNEIFLLTKEEKNYQLTQQYFPFADSIYQWEKLRRRGKYLNSESIAHQLYFIEKQITSLTKKIESENLMSDELAKFSEQTAKGLQSALKSIYDFYYGYDPQFTWWIQKPYSQVDSSLTVYANFLRSRGNHLSSQKKDSSGIVGNPIGREKLIHQLQYEFINYTPEELIVIANKEFAWCEKEMLKASRELGFGDNWKAALEKVKNTYVPEGHQPEMILDLYNQSIDFIKKNNLITIPSLAEETWRMRMMSPKQQLVSPFFLGGEELLIAYPTNTMNDDEKMMSMRGNNPHFSRATVHHELIAGHGLEFFMNERNKLYRKYYTPFWIEGWSLYWEFILWDLNFPRNAEDKIGMLFWRMHRCARIIFSLNYHLNNWSPQECINFLMDKVGHEKANAEGEVRRSFTGGYGPLYQLAYMTGGLQFYALKKELVDSKKMSYQEFHDAVLKENSLPIELLRAILTNQKLSKNYSANWRFYELP